MFGFCFGSFVVVVGFVVWFGCGLVVRWFLCFVFCFPGWGLGCDACWYNIVCLGLVWCLFAVRDGFWLFAGIEFVGCG